MSFMHMFLLKNIYIVHRLHEKLTKSKRFKEDIARKFGTVTKNAKLRFVVERAVLFKEYSVEQQVIGSLDEQR